MRWSWAKYGFSLGLFLGVLVQDRVIQQDFWAALPYVLQRIWITLTITGRLFLPNNPWFPLLVFGLVGAVCALVLHLLIQGAEYHP
jgi:hypothetical protein